MERLKTGDEMVQEYEARFMRREASTRRINPWALAVGIIIAVTLVYGPDAMQRWMDDQAYNSRMYAPDFPY